MLLRTCGAERCANPRSLSRRDWRCACLETGAVALLIGYKANAIPMQHFRHQLTPPSTDLHRLQGPAQAELLALESRPSPGMGWRRRVQSRHHPGLFHSASALKMRFGPGKVRRGSSGGCWRSSLRFPCSNCTVSGPASSRRACATSSRRISRNCRSIPTTGSR